MNNISGVYQIRNLNNNKIYIGSSIDIPTRWKQHVQSLNKNKHHNFHLQKSWLKYGMDMFKFEIVELVDEELLFSAEQKWINKSQSYDGNYGYNLSIEASRPNNIKDATSHLNCNLVMRENLCEIQEMKLNKNDKLTYYIVRDYVQYPENCVMINGNIPSITDLEEFIGLSDRAIRESLKVLEEKSLIKLVQSSHKKAIYINPLYYASGKTISKETLELFEI